ncbi:type II toxin-antitoxin system VapC family toxin [Candidatus Woesearchaeota archaeon]|nr:type II toxin-antitoxin system VapC family toxin [Candidatus Woesearchaeota archaeon]
MTLVFDTNILIDIERGDTATLRSVAELSQCGQPPAITAPTYAEYYYGLLKKPLASRLRAIRGLDVYTVLNTTKESARLIAELKQALEKAGTALSVFDLFIAAIALDQGATLVTRDKAFTNVPQLKVEVV